MNKYWWLVVVALAAALGAAVFLRGRDNIPGQFDDFAKCLTEKGAVMYGTYWYSHCKDQKADFGGSFKYITYVECSVETKKCTDDKIEGTPTWIFGSGERIVGRAPLANLAEKSGCVLPGGAGNVSPGSGASSTEATQFVPQ